MVGRRVNCDRRFYRETREHSDWVTSVQIRSHTSHIVHSPIGGVQNTLLLVAQVREEPKGSPLNEPLEVEEEDMLLRRKMMRKCERYFRIA